MNIQSMIIAILVCLAGTVFANQPDQDELMSLLEEYSLLAVDSNSFQTEIDASKADFQRLRQDLMFGQMQPLREKTSEEQEAGLNQLIQQLRSLSLPPQLMEQQNEARDSHKSQESNETKVVSQAGDEQAGDEQETVPGRLEKVSQAAYPLKLADTLFRQGYFAEALKYYEAIDGQLETNDVVAKQWILFQMANCLYITEEKRATELYGKLIEQYPNSAWSSVAAARKTTIEWKQKSQVQGILNNNVNPSE